MAWERRVCDYGVEYTPLLSRYRLASSSCATATIKPPRGQFHSSPHPIPPVSRTVISFLRRHVTFSTPPTKSDPISRNFWSAVATRQRKASRKGAVADWGEVGTRDGWAKRRFDPQGRPYVAVVGGLHSRSSWRGWNDISPGSCLVGCSSASGWSRNILT